VASEIRQRLESILPLVAKPTRYLGNEMNVVRKDPRRVRIQWLLILPEVYEIGMSHQGLRILYDVLNRREDTLAERAYAPWLDMEELMRRHGIPLFSLESHRPARAFDVVGFSLQYELTCTNILNLLDLAGIPVWQRDRTDEDPLVVAGGPVASNPEPMAEFFDAILIGDGEEAVHEMTECLAETRGAPRRERLRALARIPGVYVPSLYEPEYDAQGRLRGVFPRDPAAPERVARRFLPDLEEAPYPERPLVPVQEIVQDRLNVEVLRGCTQGCRFCQAGYFYRPLRERSLARIVEMTTRGLAASGWDEVSLTSLSTADHTQIAAITDVLARRLAPEHVGISLPSLRADRFSVSLAEKVRVVRKSGFTFAPEAGSERLRFRINKLITDAEFYQAVEAAYAAGWRLIKLYFMIGLPTETEEDVEAIVRMVERVREIGRPYGGAVRVHASVGSFVPKAHTPFQWEPFQDRGSLGAKLAHLRRRIPSRWSRLKFHDVDSSFVEAVLSMGDRRLGRAIHEAWRRGARFDGWTEQFDIRRWEEAFRAAGVDPLAYTRAKDPAEPLPWDHIDIHVTKKFLLKERERAIQGRTTKDCRYGDCVACGIPGMPKDTRLSPPPSPEELASLLGHGAADAHGASPSEAHPRDEALPEPARTGQTAPKEACAAPRAPHDPCRSPNADPSRLPTHRLLARYAKLGDARFIGQLDLVHTLARALRRARVPLAYSQGFNPRPRIVVASPLPVGIESIGEVADLYLMNAVTWDELRAAQPFLPEGLRLVGAEPLELRAPSASETYAAAQYVVALPEALLGRAREAVARFHASERWPVRKRHRKGWREVDLRRAALRLAWSETGVPWDEEPEARELEDLLRGSFWERPRQLLLALDLRLADPEGHVLNPHAALEALLELTREELAACRILRVRLVREATPDAATSARGVS
jgi:radical SAM family uncharacterized protein/radical SAM-linked protein